jgi:hypothetical protein
LVAALGAFISDLDKWSQHILIASICLAGICSVLIMRERLKKWALGDQ